MTVYQEAEKEDFDIDYFTFTMRPSEAMLPHLKSSIQTYLNSLGYSLATCSKSFYGYEFSFDILRPCLESADKEVLLKAGVFAYSADLSTKYTVGVVLSLTGLGCEGFDFIEFIKLYKAEEFKPRITRLDVKKDYFNRELVFSDFVGFYHQGLFAGERGISPRYNLIEPKDIEGNKKGGYTLYVGKRGGWRFARIYEKHHQMESLGVTMPIYQLRFEIEFRSNNDCEIPLNVFENISGFVSLSYPRLYNKLLCSVPESFDSKLHFKRKAFEVPLHYLMQHLKQSYGGVIYAMKQNGMTDAEIVMQLTKTKLPSRLIFPVKK